MLAKIWERLRGRVADEEVRADEEVVRRELQASASAPELETLAAARGATLVHVRGVFIEADDEAPLPGAPIPGMEMVGVTLEFDQRALLCLAGHGHGEGLTPCAVEDVSGEGVDSRDLDELEPFASVIGRRLRELTLLSYRGHHCHVGIRLQFEGAELVFLNLWDDIEVYDGLVPEVLQYRQRGHLYAQLYEYPFDRAS